MLTIDNFFEASVGVWSEIPGLPNGFVLLYESGKSKYFTNPEKTVVVRFSNHWGSGIRQCNWYLGNALRQNAWGWRGGSKWGMIRISDLIDVRMP
jgi:hypothetical protein